MEPESASNRLAASSLPKFETAKVKPIAQHSQPMTLRDRRERISAPTAANTKTGRNPRTTSNNFTAADRV
jgi:hypothetical protein